MSAEEGQGQALQSEQQHEQHQEQPQHQPVKEKADEPMQEAAHQNGGEQGQQGGGEPQQHTQPDGDGAQQQQQQQQQQDQGAASQMEGVEHQQKEGEKREGGDGAQHGEQQDGARAGGEAAAQQQDKQEGTEQQDEKEGEHQQEGSKEGEEKEGEKGDRERKSSRGDKESSRDKERDRDVERKEKDRKREKEKEREREKEKDRKREKEKERERSRERRHKSSSRRSRSRSRDRKKSSSRRSRSASRDRRRRRSRSRSRDRKRASSRRSRSRDRRRSSSRDRRRSKARSSSSDSEAGGYKPRRKHTPPSVIGPGTGADPFANMRQMAVPQDPQAQMRMWQLQQLQARHMVLEQQAKSAATATSKTQREVYVGGLTPGVVTAEALRTLFNSALSVQFAHQLMAGMDPVINVNMHPEGKFAFVEFRNPDMATAALALHQQVQLMGCNLAVARPSGYMDPVKASKACNAAKMALSAFERNDMEALKEAVLQGANLHGLGLPEHIVNPHQPVQLPPGVSVDGLSAAPTPDLCFTGMVTAQRLESDSEYKDMIDDLRDQCNEFVADSVVDVKCPRPYDPMLSDQYIGIANYGKIFVKYKDTEAAKVCKDKIHGRLYGGQLVQAYFISEEAFAKAG